jgi:hypothetical protein
MSLGFIVCEIIVCEISVCEIGVCEVGGAPRATEYRQAEDTTSRRILFRGLFGIRPALQLLAS